MKLYEEFKLFEDLWEDKEVSQVNQILRSYKDFEYEYDGFNVEWSEDHWDPFKEDHYTTDGVSYVNDYKYKVDAFEMFTYLYEDIIPKYADKYSNDKVLAEYLRLYQLSVNASPEEEDKAEENLDLYLANNLDYLEDLFSFELHDFFEERAREWAEDNWYNL